MRSKSVLKNPGDYSSFQRCCQDLLKGLATQDYATATIRQYERTVDEICKEIRHRNITSYPLKESIVVELQEWVLGNPKSSGYHYRLKKLVKHLTDAGKVDTPRAIDKSLSPRECLSKECEQYLRVQRGLSDSTIYHSIRIYEQFITFRFGKELGDLNRSTPDDVVTFPRQITKRARQVAVRQPSHLRSLLKFLFWSKRITTNLTNCVPRVAQPQSTNLPRYLPPSDIQRILKSVRSDSDIGRPNYAMRLLMARLGLRATEVITIQSEDINWRNGEILIREKASDMIACRYLPMWARA